MPRTDPRGICAAAVVPMIRHKTAEKQLRMGMIKRSETEVRHMVLPRPMVDRNVPIRSNPPGGMPTDVGASFKLVHLDRGHSGVAEAMGSDLDIEWSEGRDSP